MEQEYGITVNIHYFNYNEFNHIGTVEGSKDLRSIYIPSLPLNFTGELKLSTLSCLKSTGCLIGSLI